MYHTVMKARLQLAGEPPCPLFAMLQGEVQHIWAPRQYGWITAMEVGGHEHENYPICHKVLSL